jgi:hypothetical protein
MTTFTRIPDGETATITVDARHRIAKINDNIYGGFTESVEYTNLVNEVLRHYPDTWAVASTEAYMIEGIPSRTKTDFEKTSLRHCKS